MMARSSSWLATARSCSACAQLADAERALDRLLEERLPQYPAPLQLKRRLQARLAPLAPPSAPNRRAVLARWAGPASLALAACVALVASLHQPKSSSSDTLVSEAVADHLRVVYRDRPNDIESGGPHQVKPWFTGRLDFALPAVFGGNDEFTLEGGSVGYYVDRKAAVLVYKRRLHTASLWVFRVDGFAFPRGDHDIAGHKAAVRHERGFHVVLWRDDQLGYALVSDLNTDELLRLAANVAGST
jgi:anti-sigma factor RsiW